MEEVVAKQGYPVDRDRDEGCQGERLVQRPGIAAESLAGPALAGDKQPGADRGTGEDQRRDPLRRGW